MKELGIMRGPFYDYATNYPYMEYCNSIDNLKESRLKDKGYHTLDFTKRNLKNKTQIVSIAREAQ
jgi:hypothetical protein